jgi:hypothetical protein
MNNREILALARTKARVYGEHEPRTRRDVERLTGIMYTGPDPEVIGKTIVVQVRRIK